MNIYKLIEMFNPKLGTQINTQYGTGIIIKAEMDANDDLFPIGDIYVTVWYGDKAEFPEYKFSLTDLIQYNCIENK